MRAAATAENGAEDAALAGGDGGIDAESAVAIEQPAKQAVAAGQNVGVDGHASSTAAGECRSAEQCGCHHSENNDLLHDVSPCCTPNEERIAKVPPHSI